MKFGSNSKDRLQICDVRHCQAKTGATSQSPNICEYFSKLHITDLGP